MLKVPNASGVGLHLGMLVCHDRAESTEGKP